jgi:hypothetical protein
VTGRFRRRSGDAGDSGPGGSDDGTGHGGPVQELEEMIQDQWVE